MVWRIAIQHEEISSDSMPTASISACDRPRLVTRYPASERIQALNACPGGAVSSSASASPQTAPTWLRNTAACRSVRVGKCRYRVPMPTPARRAMSSSGASAPFSANAAVAAAISRAWFCRASARNWSAGLGGPWSDVLVIAFEVDA